MALEDDIESVTHNNVLWRLKVIEMKGAVNLDLQRAQSMRLLTAITYGPVLMKVCNNYYSIHH